MFAAKPASCQDPGRNCFACNDVACRSEDVADKRLSSSHVTPPGDPVVAGDGLFSMFAHVQKLIALRWPRRAATLSSRDDSLFSVGAQTREHAFVYNDLDRSVISELGLEPLAELSVVPNSRWPTRAQRKRQRLPVRAPPPSLLDAPRRRFALIGDDALDVGGGRHTAR